MSKFGYSFLISCEGFAPLDKISWRHDKIRLKIVKAIDNTARSDFFYPVYVISNMYASWITVWKASYSSNLKIAWTLGTDLSKHLKGTFKSGQ